MGFAWLRRFGSLRFGAQRFERLFDSKTLGRDQAGLEVVFVCKHVAAVFDLEWQQGLLGFYLAAGEYQQSQAQQRRNPARSQQVAFGVEGCVPGLIRHSG
ncbi:hypothetical protein D3C81_1887110 [compost metagenome]